MGKLELRVKVRKTSRKNENRFYTSRDMAIIKRDASIRRSQIKRGDVEEGGTEVISVCGCGAEGCFIHSGYDSDVA